MKTEIKSEIEDFKLSLSERSERANQYIILGTKGKYFWSLNEKSHNADNHAFIGSLERFNDLITEIKKNTSKDIIEARIKIFCLSESEDWFKGFPDDSTKNRMDFTASLYEEIKKVKY